jgi:DNA-binding transcriptional LysR family regulator
MELYQLENFVAVVEEHSFTRAAERVFRTQGAVSVAIRKLEDEIGVPLLVRDSHDCLLTEAGEELLGYARRMIELRDRLTRSMVDFRNLSAGSVSIAAHESAAEYLLAAPLAEFNVQYPNLKIEARLCDGHEIAHLVAEREVDVGFGISQTSHHGLCSEVLHVDPLVLVVAPDHPFSGRQTVSIGELGNERFFMHSRNTTMIDTVQRLFASHQVPLNVAARLWKFETIKHFVRTGGGVAIMPTSVVRSDLEGKTLVGINVKELHITRSIEVFYREKEAMLPAPQALLNLLRQWPWRRYSPVAPNLDVVPNHLRSALPQEDIRRVAV